MEYFFGKVSLVSKMFQLEIPLLSDDHKMIVVLFPNPIFFEIHKFQTVFLQMLHQDKKFYFLVNYLQAFGMVNSRITNILRIRNIDKNICFFRGNFCQISEKFCVMLQRNMFNDIHQRNHIEV